MGVELQSIDGQGLTPPSDKRLEAEVLAACIISPDQAIEIAERLEPEDFYNSTHRHIWTAIRSCWDRYRTFDEALLRAELVRAGVWEAVGFKFITGLMSRSGYSGHVEAYARALKDLRFRRELIRAAQDIELAALSTDEVIDTVGTVERRLRAATELAAPNECTTGASGADGFVEWAASVVDGEPQGFRASSGIRDLDDRLGGGLGEGWLALILARAGEGKSALAQQFAIETLRAGRAVLMVNREMTTAGVMGRMFASVRGRSVDSMRQILSRGDRRASELLSEIVSTRDEIAEWPLVIEPPGTPMTPQRLRLLALRAVQTTGVPLGLVVFDYVQIGCDGFGPTKDATEEQRIAGCSRALKLLALEYECPVIAISQPTSNASRGVGADRALRLSDAKGSQALGADCDVCLVPHRAQMGQPGEHEAPTAAIYCRKFRHGSQFVLNGLSFNPDRVAFE